MDTGDRSYPVPAPDERQALTQWLDFQRGTVRPKCHGVDDDAARRAWVPTSPSLTIAGIVMHLTNVERSWLARSFLGKDEPDPVPDWAPTDLPLADLLDAYDQQCAISRDIVAHHDLDALEQRSPPGLPRVTLRWILGHLIHETARHLGHLDLLRELTDGERGY